MNQGQKHGFFVEENEFDVVNRRWFAFGKGHHKISILSVTYEGLLTVSDAAMFGHVMKKGLGRGKAYGMGLMTVMSPSLL